MPKRKAKGLSDEEILGLEVPKLTPLKRNRPEGGGPAADPELSTQSDHTASPQARPTIAAAASPRIANEDETLDRVRNAFFTQMTENIKHKPEWIVWGQDVTFKTLKYHPALVVTETIRQFVSPRTLSAIQEERDKLSDSTTSKWTMVEPRRGERVLVVFIFDKDGPDWNVADLSGKQWMPWTGFDGDEKSRKEAGDMLSKFEPILKNKSAKVDSRVKARELKLFQSAASLANEMHRRAVKAKEEEQELLLAQSDQVAPEPEKLAAVDDPLAHLPNLCEEEGTLSAGDIITLVRQSEEKRVRIVAVAQDSIELEGGYSLSVDESVKHHRTWYDSWTKLKRKVSRIKVAPIVENQFEALKEHVGQKLLEVWNTP